MVRINKRPFPAAAGMIFILAAVLVLAGCSTQKDSVKERGNNEDAVLYIDDKPVSEEEYAMLAKEYSNQVYMKYTTEQVNHENFWTNEVDGTAPYELLDEIIQEELLYNYTIKNLAVELSVVEDYTYEDLLALAEEENASRSETGETTEDTVYGLTGFSDETYYKYWYSNLETQVINALIENDVDVSDKECQNYYEGHPEEFLYETGVTVLYGEISSTANTGQDPQEAAQRLKQAMENTDSLSDLSEQFPNLSVQKLDLNSANTQEGTSGNYSYRWQTASQMSVGQIIGPYEDNGMLCVMKCIDRNDNGKIDFETVKNQIQRYLQVQEAQEMINTAQQKMEIEKGNVPVEDIIVSAGQKN